MRAELAQGCPHCPDGIAVGDQIEKFCGKWVHSDCKKVELTRRIVQKDYVEVVPTDMSLVTSDQIIGTRRHKRRGLKHLKARQGL